MGHEDEYLVSSFGRVKSLARTIATARSERRLAERILSTAPNSAGYPCVTIAGRTAAVHVLVASAFLGARPARLEVLHANDIKADSWIGNLSYGSRSENARDAVRHGARNRRCDRGHKLTRDNVFVRSDGIRVCLECLRDRDRRSPATWRAMAMKAVETDSHSA